MYERDQYSKGYNDGQIDILNDIREHLVNDRYSERVMNGETRYVDGINFCIALIDEMLTECQEGTNER